MHVLEIETQGDYEEERRFLEISIDGDSIFNVGDGEPEDSNLRRDFNDCYKIVDLIYRAYRAGAKGEDLTIMRLPVGAGSLIYKINPKDIEHPTLSDVPEAENVSVAELLDTIKRNDAN